MTRSPLVHHVPTERVVRVVEIHHMDSRSGRGARWCRDCVGVEGERCVEDVLLLDVEPLLGDAIGALLSAELATVDWLGCGCCLAVHRDQRADEASLHQFATEWGVVSPALRQGRLCMDHAEAVLRAPRAADSKHVGLLHRCLEVVQRHRPEQVALAAWGWHFEPDIVATEERFVVVADDPLKRPASSALPTLGEVAPRFGNGMAVLVLECVRDEEVPDVGRVDVRPHPHRLAEGVDHRARLGLRLTVTQPAAHDVEESIGLDSRCVAPPNARFVGPHRERESEAPVIVTGDQVTLERQGSLAQANATEEGREIDTVETDELVQDHERRFEYPRLPSLHPAGRKNQFRRDFGKRKVRGCPGALQSDVEVIAWHAAIPLTVDSSALAARLGLVGQTIQGSCSSFPANRANGLQPSQPVPHLGILYPRETKPVHLLEQQADSPWSLPQQIHQFLDTVYPRQEQFLNLLSRTRALVLHEDITGWRDLTTRSVDIKESKDLRYAEVGACCLPAGDTIEVLHDGINRVVGESGVGCDTKQLGKRRHVLADAPGQRPQRPKSLPLFSHAANIPVYSTGKLYR